MSPDNHRMMVACAGFFGKALHQCVPLRGGIAYGDFLFNPEKILFCGPSLVRAYELGQIAQWSGIVVDDEVAAHYKKNPIKSYGSTVIERRIIPDRICKHETKPHRFWVLNWTIPYKANFTVSAPISSELYSTAFKSLFKSDYRDWPKDVRAIYDNTVDFINSSLKKQRRKVR